MAILTETKDIARVLRESRTIAVLGANVREQKPAYYVPDYLADNGYAIFPVNPSFESRTLWGETVVSTLSELTTPIDIVDVFRRSEHLPDHLEDMLAMNPLPKVVWFQLGIQHDDVAERLSREGVDVVQNRCLLVDHQRLL